MPATLFPPPASTGMVREYMPGLSRALTAQASFAGRTEDDVASSHLRAAQGALERLTTIPFFVTRFSTRVLAQSQGEVLGTDFDRLESPLPYDIDQYRNGLGRLDLPWIPLNTVDALWLSLSGANAAGKIAEIPVGWLERDDTKGVLNILPHGESGLTLVFQRMFGFLPGYYGAGATGVVPVILHPKYSAGLVQLPADPTTWDMWEPEDAEGLTDFWPELVAEYQKAIAQLAAGRIMLQVQTQLDRGGTSIAIDGLSRSVSPVLLQRGQEAIQAAQAWAQSVRDEKRGLIMAFV